jgi:hypothetical protein
VSLAILRRSEMDLQTCLTRLGANTLKSQLEETEYTCALASWPRGIESLIVNGILEDYEPLLDILWASAIRLQYSESALSLLQCKIDVTVADWDEACYSWQQESNDGADMAERARRSQVFDILAHRLSASRHNLPSSSKKLGSDESIWKWPSPYHTSDLSLLAAQSAWKAGFRDLNSTLHGVPPLWTILDRWKPDALVFLWLSDHGADSTWTHPTLLTTPGHKIARLTADTIKMSSVDLSLLIYEQRDDCTCYCSLKGCFMIGCAVSTMHGRYYRRSRRAQSRLDMDELGHTPRFDLRKAITYAYLLLPNLR